MKSKKIVYAILIIVCTLIVGTGTVVSTKTANADSKNTNIEKMTKSEVKSNITGILDAAINNDDSKILEYKDLFTEDSLEKFRRNIINKNIIDGIISETVIDVITPENSETLDTVLMCNIRLVNRDNAYNKICLFEFHINEDGKIYGYNVWKY